MTCCRNCQSVRVWLLTTIPWWRIISVCVWCVCVCLGVWVCVCVCGESVWESKYVCDFGLTLCVALFLSDTVCVCGFMSVSQFVCVCLGLCVSLWVSRCLGVCVCEWRYHISALCLCVCWRSPQGIFPSELVFIFYFVWYIWHFVNFFRSAE